MKNIDNYTKFGQEISVFASSEHEIKDAEFYKLAFLNWYANVLYGSRQSSVTNLISYYKENTSGREMKVIGRKECLDHTTAVVTDCFSSVSLAYDDIHYETTLHPAAPVAAAIIGIARKKKMSGKQLCEALQIGLEAEIRCAKAMFGTGSGASAGWYVSGIVGGIGAATAVGHHLGLSTHEMETAIGLAASKAAGLRGSHGAMSTYLVPAFAAESGYSAALMAAHGITCKLNALTGKEGLLQIIAQNPQIEMALEGIGEKYLCEDTACKPYPYGFIAHAMIAGCIEIARYMEKHKRRLKKMFVQVSPVCVKLGSNPVPDNAFDAHTALPYIAALIMQDEAMAYTPVEENFSVSEETIKMENLIDIRQEASFSNSQATCHAIFEDGTEKEVRIDLSAHHGKNEMKREDIIEKSRKLIRACIGEKETEDIIDRILHLEDVEDVKELVNINTL